MERNKKRKIGHFFISLSIFIFTMGVIGGMSFLMHYSMLIILRNLVMGGIGIIIFLYLLSACRVWDSYDYNNREHPVRFLIFFLISLVFAVICGFFPTAGWPYAVVFLLLSLYSNPVIGFTGGMILLMISMMISGAGPEVFVMYGFCGIAITVLFRKLDQSFKIGVPFFVSLMMLILSLTANAVLFSNEEFSIELFVIPVINILVTAVFMLIILKLFSVSVIFKYRNRYMTINDPEFELLVRLKDYSEDEYYQAVHTAYFCDRIASRLSLDVQAVKACGYYHNITVITGDRSIRSMHRICEKYKFPKPVREILDEYLDDSRSLQKKETAVLMFSDVMISSILFLMSKNNSDIDYEQVIETVFQKKLESGILSECEITMKELECMKEIFRKEQLYYDFLRRK